MQAVVYHGPRDLAVTDIPDHPLRPGDVRVTVRIPPIVGLRVLGTVSASAHFRPQR